MHAALHAICVLISPVWDESSSRDSLIADCTVRHPGVERCFLVIFFSQSRDTDDGSIRDKLRHLADQALSRAEQLKGGDSVPGNNTLLLCLIINGFLHIGKLPL